MPEISSAIEFLKRVRTEDAVTIKFIKQDGTERVMRCTLNFSRIPPESKPKKVDLAKILKLIDENGILHVFDLEKQEWRSVPFERVKWLQTSTARFFIKLEKKKKKGEE